jgi:hypothetical protein
MNRDIERGNLGRESAGAIRIHCVGSHYAQLLHVSVCAYRCGSGSAAVPIELPIDLNSGKPIGGATRVTPQPSVYREGPSVSARWTALCV